MTQQVIVVTKRTAWEQYQAEPNDVSEMGDDARQRAQASHSRHHRSLDSVLAALKSLRVKPWIVEGAETMFDVGTASLVVTVGGDGTLLSASHHVPKGVPLLGINSDPVFSKGHFCWTVSDDALHEYLEKALDETKRPIVPVTRMKVTINNRVVADRILNEALYSHTCPAAMTRLLLTTGELPDSSPQAFTRYACSGVWIGTGAGTTGAIASAGGFKFNPNVKMLEAVVREPWNPPKVGNEVYTRRSFTLVSKTVDSTLYLDGPFLRVPVGFDQTVVFEVSDDHLSLVMS